MHMSLTIGNKQEDKHSTNFPGKISMIYFSCTFFLNLPVQVFDGINVNTCPTDLTLVVERL